MPPAPCRPAKRRRRPLAGLLAWLLAGLLALAPWRAEAAAAMDWSRAVVDSTMRRFPDAAAMPWRYARALFLSGVHEVYGRTREPAYLAYVRRWGDARVRADGAVVDRDARGNAVPVDFWALDLVMPGQMLATLFRATGEERYRLAARRVRAQLDGWPRAANGGFWHSRRSPGQLWADGAFMSTSFLVAYASTFPDGGRSRDEAARQLLAYAGVLQDSATGLLRHAWHERRTAPWADPATGRAPEAWCRANGWFGMALVGALEILPPGHPQRAALLAVLRRLVAGLERFQDRATWRWFEVMDKGGLAGNWVETSCSAMHAFTIARAVERGWVAGPYHARAALAGYRGTLATASIGGDGLADVGGIVVGTSVGNLAYYLARPRLANDFHGLGAFLLMNEQFARAPLAAAGLP